MIDNFEQCLEKLLQHEGGFVNDSRDNGGMTNLGVTMRVWEEWVGHPVSEKEMRSLTPLMVSQLYKRKYWDACHADDFVSGLDYADFDCAVNSGVGRAIKLLQSCVGADADGGYGSITSALVKKASSDADRLIGVYCSRRLEFLSQLKSFPVFGKGWSKRVSDVRQTALEMAKNEIQQKS